MVLALPALRAAVLTPQQSAWTPRSLPNLALWLDAARITGLADGAAVATWADQSGNGRDATQATGSKRPTYRTSGIGGKPVVRFDGGDHLATAAIDWTAQTALTIVAVGTAASSGVQAYVVQGNSDTQNTAWNLYCNSNRPQAYVRSNASDVNVTSPATLASPHILTLTINRALTTNETTLHTDGSADAGYSANPNSTSTFGNEAIHLGARDDTPVWPLTGDLAEVLIYTRALSASERQALIAYLGAKYGIAVTVPTTTWAWSQALGSADLHDNAHSDAMSGYVYANPCARAVATTTATRGRIDGWCSLAVASAPGKILPVRVNGADVAAPIASDGSFTAEFALPGGAQTVEVVAGSQSGGTGVLSAVAGVWLQRLSLNDAGAALVAPSPTNRLLIYGDSIAVGVKGTAYARDGWSLLLRNARAGSTILEGWESRSLHEDCNTAPLRAAFVAKIVAANPAKIWLAIGTNDYGSNKWSAASFGTAYAALLDDLHTALPSAAIFCQTPLLRNTETANGSGNTLGDYRTQIATAVSTRTSYATLVDGTAILTTGDLSDGTHPSTAGHAKYALYVTTNYPSL